MTDTVKMKINVDGMDEAQAKIDALYEKMTEAKTLAAELASALDGLRISFDVDREIDLVVAGGAAISPDTNSNF